MYGGVRTSLRNHEGKGVVRVGEGVPIRWRWREALRVAVPSNNHDPKEWRNRADEVRAVAEHISDPAARLDMLRIAGACEQMAKWIELRAAKPDTQD